MHYSNFNSSVTGYLKQQLFRTRDTERPSDSDTKTDGFANQYVFNAHFLSEIEDTERDRGLFKTLPKMYDRTFC